MFQGDIQELMITENPRDAEQQCNPRERKVEVRYIVIPMKISHFFRFFRKTLIVYKPIFRFHTSLIKNVAFKY